MPHLILSAPAAATEIPTTNLLYNFDGNDTANQNLATGVWTKSGGSASSTLQMINDSNSATTFANGAAQNGLTTVACPLDRAFRFTTGDNTDYAEATILMAFRMRASSTHPFGIGSDSQPFSAERSGNDALIFLNDTTSVTATLSKTNIAALDGSFRIAGFIFSDTQNFIIPISAGSFSLASLTTNAGSMSNLRMLNSTCRFGAASGGGGGWADDADIDIGQILGYSGADIGQAMTARQALMERWGVLT